MKTKIVTTLVALAGSLAAQAEPVGVWTTLPYGKASIAAQSQLKADARIHHNELLNLTARSQPHSLLALAFGTAQTQLPLGQGALLVQPMGPLLTGQCDQYGNFAASFDISKLGINRLFVQAFALPLTAQRISEMQISEGFDVNIVNSGTFSYVGPTANASMLKMITCPPVGSTNEPASKTQHLVSLDITAPTTGWVLQHVSTTHKGLTTDVHYRLVSPAANVRTMNIATALSNTVMMQQDPGYIVRILIAQEKGGTIARSRFELATVLAVN